MKSTSRVSVAIMTAAWLGLAVPASGANPYEPAIVVNNGVITEYDITQRERLLDALGAPGDLRELAVEQLKEDRVKVQAADAMDIELPEDALERGLEEFAEGRGLTVEQVLQVLQSRDIDRRAMDDFVEAGLKWREVVGISFRDRATPSEADVAAALEMAATTPRVMLQLGEIALPFAERGAETVAFADDLARQIRQGADFETLARRYSRSGSAARGGRVDPMEASGLPQPIRAQVLQLRPGQITDPIPISGGVAILKLLGTSLVAPEPVDTDDPEVREALRQRLFSERIAAFGEGHLQELLADAVIEER